MGSIAGNLTSSTPNLRFCPECVNEDLAIFGESYWRREHQLPAVSMCQHHGHGLLVSTIAIRAQLPVPPPHQCKGTDSCCRLPASVQLAISKWSWRSLNFELQREQTWPDWFRERAREVVAERMLKEGRQANLTILMRRAGVESLWRHSYPRLPRLKAWVTIGHSTNGEQHTTLLECCLFRAELFAPQPHLQAIWRVKCLRRFRSAYRGQGDPPSRFCDSPGNAELFDTAQVFN